MRPPRLTWSRKSRSALPGGVTGGGRSGIVCLDFRRDSTVQLGDALGGVAVEATEDDDAREVGLVAVVEDEVVPGCVVAQVTDARVRAAWLTVEGERSRQRPGLLNATVVDHVDRHRQLCHQVARCSALSERGIEAALTDGDLDPHPVLLRDGVVATVT